MSYESRAVQNGEGNRFREEIGRYFEDFNVGDVYEHRPGRTINEADNSWFTLLTMNTHPLHFDAEYAKDSEFGKILVNSCLTLSIVAGMSVSDVSQKAIANLGWTDIKLPAPVFIGDTIYAETEVLEKRESKSRPTQGIVSVRTKGTKSDGTVFMTFDRTILVAKHGHGIENLLSSPYKDFPHKEDLVENLDFTNAIKKVITEIAKQGSVLILGRGASGVLRNDERALKVGIYCDFDIRIKKYAQREGITEEESRKKILEYDEGKKNYYLNIFQKQPLDLSLIHI